MSMLVDAYRFGGGGGGDPYIAFRVAITNLNVDLSDPLKTWTANGGAAVTGGWLVLDGVNDNLSTPQSTDFDFGSGDFCLEAFVDVSSIPGTMAIAGKWQAGALSWLFGIDGASKLFIYTQVGGLNYFPATSASVPTGTPIHLAVYRLGNNWYAAINGVYETILSVAGSMNATSQQVCIGAQSDGVSSLFTGKIRGFRATKGSTGGYGAANFTPPSFPLPTS